MGTDPRPPNSVGLPPAGGRFSWSHTALWLAGTPILGAIAAWGAVIAQFYFAPFLLFPVLVGIGLGAMLVGLMRIAQIGNRPTIFAGAVLAAAVAIVGEHYISYQETQRRQDRADAETLLKARQAFPELLKGRDADTAAGFLGFMHDQAAKGRPLILGYKASGAGAWASWAVDGLLLLIVTVSMVVPATRQPYCNCCRSWYRTIRSGRVSAAAAQQLAQLANSTVGQQIKSARYRLSNCSSGCGMTRLELSWEELDGRTFLNVMWLDGDQRDLAGRTLDAIKREG